MNQHLKKTLLDSNHDGLEAELHFNLLRHHLDDTIVDKMIFYIVNTHNIHIQKFFTHFQ